MMGKWEFHLLLFWPYVCLNSFLPQTGCLKILNKVEKAIPGLGYSHVEMALWKGNEQTCCAEELTGAVEGEWGGHVGVEQRVEGNGAQGTFCSGSR